MDRKALWDKILAFEKATLVGQTSKRGTYCFILKST